MYRLKQIFLLLTGLILLGVLAGNPLQASPAPRLTSEGLVKLIAEGKGKIVVVNFWATWCGPCKREIPELIKLREATAENELEILGISVDFNRDMLTRYMETAGFNYPIYWATRDVSLDFEISSIPKLLIYDQNGELVVDHVGFYPPAELKKKIHELLGR